MVIIRGAAPALLASFRFMQVLGQDTALYGACSAFDVALAVPYMGRTSKGARNRTRKLTWDSLPLPLLPHPPAALKPAAPACSTAAPAALKKKPPAAVVRPGCTPWSCFTAIMSSEFWMVALPNSGDEQDVVLNKIKRATTKEGRNDLSEVERVDLPGLVVGTLDSLMALRSGQAGHISPSLTPGACRESRLACEKAARLRACFVGVLSCSDDLVKVDFQIESLVKRIDRQYRVRGLSVPQGLAGIWRCQRRVSSWCSDS